MLKNIKQGDSANHTTIYQHINKYKEKSSLTPNLNNRISSTIGR